MEQVVIPGTIDARARYTSFMEYKNIYKIYTEILGQNYVDHFCINAIPESSGKMLIFSINPQIAYNVYSDSQAMKKDLVISPSFYNTMDFYFWHDCYRKQDAASIIMKKERPYGIKTGAVIIKRIQGLVYMLSFATKSNPENFQQDILHNKSLYDGMGVYCLEKMQQYISRYFKK